MGPCTANARRPTVYLRRGLESHNGHLRSNLGRIVYTYVPLSQSSITWYWSKDGDVFGWENDRRPGEE